MVWYPFGANTLFSDKQACTFTSVIKSHRYSAEAMMCNAETWHECNNGAHSCWATWKRKQLALGYSLATPEIGRAVAQLATVTQCTINRQVPTQSREHIWPVVISPPHLSIPLASGFSSLLYHNKKQTDWHSEGIVSVIECSLGTAGTPVWNNRVNRYFTDDE